VPGVYTFPNKDCYTGSFKEDDFHGKGTMVYANGDTYEGPTPHLFALLFFFSFSVLPFVCCL
jgi:hypothetical protein